MATLRSRKDVLLQTNLDKIAGERRRGLMRQMMRGKNAEKVPLTTAGEAPLF